MSGANPPAVSGLWARFPALGRLELFQRRRMPVILQLTATECGAACLAMVLGYFGRALRLDEVRSHLGSGRDGASALALLSAANSFGLRGRGVRLEIEELGHLSPGSILHWGFNHFVVFERLHRDAVDVVDPAFGRRRLPLTHFRQFFTGVALLLEPGESFSPAPPDVSLLWRNLRAVLAHAGRWSRIAVSSLLLQVFALALPSLTGAIVDSVVPQADGHLLGVLGAGLGMLVVFHGLASLIRAHLLLEMRTHLDVRMSLGFLEHLVSLPYSFFQQRTAGDLLMRLGSIGTVREVLTSSTLSALLDGLLVSLYLLLLLVLDASMAALVLGLALLQFGVFALARRRQQALLALDLETQARAHSYEVDLLTAVETLKALGCEQRAVTYWSGLFVDVLNVALRRGRVAALVEGLLGTLRLAAPLLVLLFGAAAVLDGRYSLGTMLALSALAGGFLGPLSGLLATASQLQLVRTYIDRLEDVWRASPEQRTVPGAAPRTLTLRGGITLDSVGLRYAPEAAWAVQDVSVEICAGQFVAIVGRSGSGKSSLGNLILGLYPPTSGRVLFDGMDSREGDLGGRRRQMGVVTQTPQLFGGTLRANIALTNPEATLESIEAAAQMAHLHDEIAAMPMQYETPLIDRGTSLSGGQRQRLALARALLSQPAILLLDEATSMLDSVTERLIQADLARLRCTRIVIAHRLSTIVGADHILVMQDGRLVEQGRHAALLAQGGVYAELVAAQLSHREETR